MNRCGNIAKVTIYLAFKSNFIKEKFLKRTSYFKPITPATNVSIPENVILLRGIGILASGQVFQTVCTFRNFHLLFRETIYTYMIIIQYLRCTTTN